MTLHQLKIFQVVSQHRNITKASKVLRISQPSVFKQVKSLEESYKTKLYKKVGRGIELTEQGQLFQREVEEILSRVDRLEKNFGLRSPAPSAARLLIGASHGPSASLIPSLLANFKKTHPLVQVTLRTKDSLGIERLLAESDGVEIGVVTNLSRIADSGRLHIEPWRAEEIVFFISTKHALVRRRRVTLAELAQMPLIVKQRSQSKTLELLKQIERQGFEPNIFMECESAEAVKLAVMKNLGVGVLYRDHLSAEVTRGDLKILSIFDLNPTAIESFIIYNKSQPLSPNASEFLGLLRKSQHNSQIH
jgi:LysR family transcriptional regulator, low CO2-responsive transcriptional regulator